MKHVDYVVDILTNVQARYTYRNVFEDWLKMLLSYHGENGAPFENDGEVFDGIVEMYALKDLIELSRCGWAVFNTGGKKINFLLTVNDTLNNDAHDRLHDFIVDNFS